jgi:hypothetical protein
MSWPTPEQIAYDKSFDPPGVEPPDVLGQGGPPFWEEWRGRLPDEQIEFIRHCFEEYTGSWL